MKSAKAAGNFPYTMKTVCYIQVDETGAVLQVPHSNKSDRPNMLEAYKKVLEGTATLYAVWPGQWRSDLFLMDDLDALAQAFELV